MVLLLAAVLVAPSPQALRTCADRWNQDNMVGWGPALVSVSVRRSRCTVDLAHSWRRDVTGGCAGYAVMPGYPNRCVDTHETFVCVMNAEAGYDCSHTADGGPPLRHRNGATDAAGAMRLDISLHGTHATPPLAWQRRYPVVDSFISPWTAAGTLRHGLTLNTGGGVRHYRGTCSQGSERSRDPSALRCLSDVQLDPCYPPTSTWNRRGAVVACAAPGSTSFGRFVITRRS
jgi:hypothetical protein